MCLTITSKYLKEIKSEIEIECDSSKQAKIIYEAVLLEFKTSPDYRSKISLNLEDNKLIFKINAEDATSFRASINSAIKWMKLSQEITELIE